MRLQFTGLYQMNQRDLIRRAGYGEQMKKGQRFNLGRNAGQRPSGTGPVSLRDHMLANAGETGYIRRLGIGEFPRFHAYIEADKTGFQINLHLDQKGVSYGEETAHSGEYEGEVVEREGRRIQGVIEQISLNNF